MKISELILSGKYLEAKTAFCDRLNEQAMSMLDNLKKHYASTMFTEEFDASFKGKTDVDKAKGEDEGDEPEEDDGDEGGEDEGDDKKMSFKKDDDGDGDDDKTINVNIKESGQGLPSRGKVVPTASGKTSQVSPGSGAAENPKWKSKQKAMMAMKKALGKVDSVVSEEQNGGNMGAKGDGAGKSYTKKLNKKVPAKAKVDSVVSEENIQELSNHKMFSYFKKAVTDPKRKEKAGLAMHKMQRLRPVDKDPDIPAAGTTADTPAVPRHPYKGH
jgi:hypothetical protein